MAQLAIPTALLRQAQTVADGFASRTAVAVDAAELLTGRAALLDIAPRGQVSAGGATRLLPTRDRWCALTLSRPDDVDAIPALLQCDSVHADPWQEIKRWAAETGAASNELLASAQELSKQNAHLRNEVDRFLATVRAA